MASAGEGMSCSIKKGIGGRLLLSAANQTRRNVALQHGTTRDDTKRNNTQRYATVFMRIRL